MDMGPIVPMSFLSFIRGYLGDFQDIELKDKNRIEKASRLILGRSDGKSLTKYLSALKKYALDYWIDGFASQIGDEDVREWFLEQYRNIPDNDGVGLSEAEIPINGALLKEYDEYDGYPDKKDETGLSEALDYVVNILEAMKNYRWGENGREDQIAATYLSHCVQKTDFVLKRYVQFYDITYKQFLNRLSDEQYDFRYDTEDLSGIRLFLTEERFVDVIKSEESLSRYSEIGILMQGIVEDTVIWKVLVRVLTDDEIMRILYQTAVFYRFAAEPDEYVRFIIRYNEWFSRMNYAYLGRCIVRTAYKAKTAGASSALMGWFISRQRIQDNLDESPEKTIDELKVSSGKLIRRWVNKLNDEEGKKKFMEAKMLGDLYELDFSPREDVLEHVGKSIEAFDVPEEEKLNEISRSYMLPQLRCIIDNLRYYFSDGSRGSSFEKEYYKDERKDALLLIRQLDARKENEDVLIFRNLWLQLEEEHLSHVEKILAENLLKDIKKLQTENDTLRQENSERGQANESLIAEYQRMAREYADAVPNHYLQYRKQVRSDLEKYEEEICKVLGLPGGSLLDKLDNYGNNLKEEVYKQLNTSEMVYALLNESEKYKETGAGDDTDCTIAVLPLTKTIEMLLREALYSRIETDELIYPGQERASKRTKAFLSGKQRFYITTDDQKRDIKKDKDRIELGGLAHLFSTVNIGCNWDQWWNYGDKYADIGILEKFSDPEIKLPQLDSDGNLQADKSFEPSGPGSRDDNRTILFNALNYVREQYRNPIAHDTLTKDDYNKCKSILIAEQKLFWILAAIIR